MCVIICTVSILEEYELFNGTHSMKIPAIHVKEGKLIHPPERIYKLQRDLEARIFSDQKNRVYWTTSTHHHSGPTHHHSVPLQSLALETISGNTTLESKQIMSRRTRREDMKEHRSTKKNNNSSPKNV